MKTLRDFILEGMNLRHETFDDVVDYTLFPEELDEEFNQNHPFILWTEKYVYFALDDKHYHPMCMSLPRNPIGITNSLNRK